MTKEPVIGVVGATGVVGSEIVSLLGERPVPYSDLRLLASSGSAGEVYGVDDDEVMVEELGHGSFDGTDVVVFAARPEVVTEFLPAARDAGARVVDLSGASSASGGALSTAGVPAGAPAGGVVTLPGQASAILAPVLEVLRREAGLERVTVTAFHSVSGAGKAALDELWSQGLAVFNQKEIEIDAFEHQIAYNCIPQVDVMGETGVTREEERVVRELRSLLGLPSLKVHVTAVRVPVYYSHGFSVVAETTSRVSPAAFTAALAGEAWARTYDSPTGYPMHVDAAGSDEIHVGRVRSDDAFPEGVACWIVADNVRRGAALNVVDALRRLAAG